MNEQQSDGMKKPEDFPVGSIVQLSKIDIPQNDNLGNAAETSVAKTLLNRKSHCTACGDQEGGCSSCSSSAGTSKQQEIPDDQDWFGEVSFKARRKVLFRKRKGARIALSDLVLVESEHGTDAGYITAIGSISELQKNGIEVPHFSIIRSVSPEEMEKYNTNRSEEKGIVKEVKSKVKEFNLEMKIVDAEWQFDKTRLSIYFSAPQRVDFRDLVKELARVFHARIELRQIPAREEAKRLGGIGPCGLELCCSTFLDDFAQITLDHAKMQLLPPNISKLSGMCGRLKCCLLYEIDNYVSALKNYPPLDSYLHLKDGRARMFKVDIFTDTVTAIGESTGVFHSISLEELNELRRNGKVELPKEHQQA